MRLLHRHGPHGAGDLGALGPMRLEEGAIVHLVDVVAGQDQHQLRIAIGDEVQVLQHGVGRAAVPVTRPAAADVGLQQRHAAVAAVEVPRATDADVVHQRARGVLGQHGHVGEAGVHRVRQGEVDDPVLAAERDARLGAHLGEHGQPLTLAPGQDQGQDRCRHASDSPMRRVARRTLVVSGGVAAPAWPPSGPARPRATARSPAPGCPGRAGGSVPAAPAPCSSMMVGAGRAGTAPVAVAVIAAVATAAARRLGRLLRLGRGDHLAADGRAEAAVAEHRARWPGDSSGSP